MLTSCPEMDYWETSKFLKICSNVSQTGNCTAALTEQQQALVDSPLSYRVIATAVHVAIFLLGVVGNIVLVFVMLREKCLQTPTYRYLVSLAFADLLVLLSAIPEAVVFHHLGKQWTADQAACSLFIFTNFLGINAGSISILAFTVEIYVAICRPITSQQFCTIKRTNKVILGLWFFAVLYCSPWLGLTEVKVDPVYPFRQQCDFRLSKEQYFYIFAADFLLFYAAPLIVAIFIFTKIIVVLHKTMNNYQKNIQLGPNQLPGDDQQQNGLIDSAPNSYSSSLLFSTETAAQKQLQRQQSVDERMRSRAHVLRMLIIIVLLFAISWLPYRGLLVVNTFLETPWLNLWYLFFAKTLIYLNSAMNPFLYSAMSRRFRWAVCMTLMCREHNWIEANYENNKRSPVGGNGVEKETVQKSLTNSPGGVRRPILVRGQGVENDTAL